MLIWLTEVSVLFMERKLLLLLLLLRLPVYVHVEVSVCVRVVSVCAGSEPYGQLV